MSVLFSAVSLAGLGMILYGFLANRRPAESEDAPPGSFASGICGLDTGHEGLKHSEKEPFDPEKHKAEPL
jgi:hypothetical protein